MKAIEDALQSHSLDLSMWYCHSSETSNDKAVLSHVTLVIRYSLAAPHLLHADANYAVLIQHIILRLTFFFAAYLC